ncbi:MAG: CotH kinase family protein [Caldilineaceae bacterium]
MPSSATPPTAALTVDSGAIYDAPIEIGHTALVRAAAFREGYLPSPIATHSYIFPADVLTQPTDPPGWPTTWGTHRIDILGYRAGEPVAADYAMDPEIVNDPAYANQMLDALAALPSVSLVMDMADLDIYFEDPQARGPAAERPVSVEWIYPGAPDRDMQIDAGVRIQGGAGRWEYMPKHSFRLFFHNAYGAGKLAHPVFDNSPVQLFDTLILRAGVDRSYAGHPGAVDAPRDHHEATYTRDEWARASQIAMSGAGSHGAFVHLYLNGLYWGLYNLVERPDGSFMTSYFDGAKTDWFTASHGGAGDGPIDRFNVLLQLAQQGGLQDPDAYATMCEFIDPAQFSDYIILNWYAGNRDWPENNWYANVRNPAGQVRFFEWDAEDTWHPGTPNGAEIHLGGAGFEGAPFPNVIKLVFDALMQNEEFRLLFADRLYRQLANGGALSDAQAEARWQEINAPVERAIVAESARWGDVRYDAPITPQDWRAARDAVLAQMAGNGAALLAQARAAGYYPALDPPTFNPAPDQPPTMGGSPGYAFDGQQVLTFDAAAGTIYYTLDGTDPRQANRGAPAESAQVYAQPLTVDRTTIVKARLFDPATGLWSALAEAMYYPADSTSAVRITEIMYNPLGGDAYEFVEIQNVGERPVDLSNAYFEGIDFRFAPYTVLPPGAYKTIVADFRKFRERYPEAEIDGVYGRKLSNRGETLTLRDVQGVVLAAVTYGVDQGWPLSANGLGDSLVWTGQGDPNQAHNWRASGQINGSPGKEE